MPQVVMGPELGGKKQKKVDGSVRSAAFSFLEKLTQSDKTVGLHIESIRGAADSRVRTGRVTDFYRAVLVKFDGAAGTTMYVYLGTYPHDDAIKYARTASVAVNPISGVAELVDVSPLPAFSEESPELPIGGTEEHRKAPVSAPPHAGPSYPVLGSRGYGLKDLTDLGIQSEFAAKALAARSEDELLVLADSSPATWQGLAVVSLAVGQTPDQVRAELLAPIDADDSKLDAAPVEKIAPVVNDAMASDAALIKALQHPASQLDFAFIESDEDLRAAVEDESFARWRVFLHPEQRRYVMRNRNGAFRLSGGAGTGKTVVLVHRAKHLIESDRTARIVLTTYTRTLAESLEENLQILDPKIARAAKLGESGIHVAGIDQLVMRVLAGLKKELSDPESPGSRAVNAVLGERAGGIHRIVSSDRMRKYWLESIESVPDLPERLRSVPFMQAEYSLVVLPSRIVDQAGYVRVRREGRGVRLSRRNRLAVWQVITKYRALTSIDDVTDWDEKAALAARYLDEEVKLGHERPADSVLVDEAQDLSPARLLFLRALAPAGPNDLFLAEDSQQRIYGSRIVLSRYGIQIRGRSRRLTLNYRTTEENLRFALQVLEGTNPLATDAEQLSTENQGEAFEDMDGEAVSSSGYRSARTGPVPRVLVCDSLTGELVKASELVQEWISDGVEASSIGLLCYSDRRCELVTRGLNEDGINARYIDRQAQISSKSPRASARSTEAAGPFKKIPDPVSVMTMHRAKGMEFSRVILFNVHEDQKQATNKFIRHLPEEETVEVYQRGLALEYVAVTRARDEVVVLRQD